LFLNASHRYQKGKPKNHLVEADIKALAEAFLAGEPVDGEVAVATIKDIAAADYNLSPSRWVQRVNSRDEVSISDVLARLQLLDAEGAAVSETLYDLLRPVAR
jgi:type I restriction enzyme M protein